MAARPHDADEPHGEPRDEEKGTAPSPQPPPPPDVEDTGTSTGTGRDTGPGTDPAGGDDRDDLDDLDTDRTWDEIVTRLRATDDPRGWAPDPALEQLEEHFEPPDPGPVLGGDPLLTMAWAAAGGVPLLLLVTLLVGRDLPTAVLQVTGVLFLAALGVLVWRMPRDRSDDEGPGAVV